MLVPSKLKLSALYTLALLTGPVAATLNGCATEKHVEAAHRDFQRAVKPAADVIDEKSRAVVNEGKKAANKIAGSDTKTGDGK